MNSRGIRGQRHIQPVVDQNTRGGRARFGNRETRDLYKSARIEILLTNLNPAGSGRGRAPDGIVKRAPAKRSGIARRENRMELARLQKRAGPLRSRKLVYVRVATESVRPRSMLAASKISRAPRPVTAPRIEG